MAQDEIHVNDIGLVLTVTIKDGSSTVDISSATVTKKIKLRSPLGAVSEKPATFTTNGSDGKLYYTTVDGDLSSAGKWSIQAYVVLTAGTWHSDIEEFEVFENLS